MVDVVSKMQSMIDRVRHFLGFGGNYPDIATSKRDRADEQEDYSDDEVPSFKRIKGLGLGSTKFPRHSPMTDHGDWEIPSKSSNVRVVPIQVEGYPNTSTPNEGVRAAERRRTLPSSRFVGAPEIRPVKTQRISTPRPVLHCVDDDPEISWMEPKSKNYSQRSANQSNQEMYVLVDDDDEDEQDENDAEVIYVKRVAQPQPRKQKFFTSCDSPSAPESPRNVYNRNYREQSPRSKFKTPAGIQKVYRPKPTPLVAKWLNPIRSTTLGHIPLQKRYSQLNGNQRTAIMESFNLEEKRNYSDLIRQISERSKPTTPVTKPVEVIDLASEYSSFRATQKEQKQSLEQLHSTAKRINSFISDSNAKKENEYDPITAASLNSSSDSEVEIVPNSSNASTSSSVRIQPVNSLRSSLKECAVMNPLWVENLSSKYRKKMQEKTAKSCDVAKEVNLIGKINREQTIAQLRRHLQHDLKLTDDTELEEEPVAEIPQLTAEQEKLVDRALGPGPSGQVFIDKFNLQIHRRDLQTLAGLNWLNDEVINFYMNLIMQRSDENSDLPRVYAANTFFYPKLMQSGQAGLRRWTRKVDIFSKDLMVIPVHLDVHWCLCLVELDKKRVLYLDSMGGANQRCLEGVMQYLRDEHQDKKGKPFSDEGWKKEQLKKIPHQMNGSDCGMFACTFAEFASRRAPFTFSQRDMPRLRRKVAFEILQGKLML